MIQDDPRLREMSVHSLLNSAQKQKAIQFNNQVNQTAQNRAKLVNEINTEEREEQQLILDQKLSDQNLDMLNRHELTANLLNSASIEVQQREVEKLEKIHDILSLNAELIKLHAKNQNGNQTQLITNKEAEMETKVQALVQQFGEGELLSIGLTSTTHYTLGDLKDDLNHAELKYISEVPSLQIATIDNNASTTPKFKNSSSFTQLFKLLV